MRRPFASGVMSAVVGAALIAASSCGQTAYTCNVYQRNSAGQLVLTDTTPVYGSSAGEAGNTCHDSFHLAGDEYCACLSPSPAFP